MYVDAQNTFSREQAITATDYSTDVIDTGNRGVGDTDLTLHITINESVVGGNVTFALESTDTTDFSTTKTENISKEYPASELAIGSNPVILRISHITGRYLRVKFTPSATLSAGKFTARLVEGAQTNR